MWYGIGATVCVIILAMLAYDAFRNYKLEGAEGGGLYDRFLAIGKQSLTIAIARLGAISGLSLDLLVDVAHVISSPTVSGALSTYLPQVKAVSWTLIIAAVVVEWSRRRTMDGPPIIGPGD
jgi:hypothetical protein